MKAKVVTLRLPATEQLRLAVCAAREATGLSLVRAALDVRCDKDTILAWEHGDSRPDVAKLLDAPKMGPAFARELAKVAELRLAAASQAPGASSAGAIERTGKAVLGGPLLRIGESASHLAHNQETPRSTRGSATNRRAA